MNKDRRNILKAALGVACVPLTPSQPEGPFYPIHEQLEKDFDMTTMNGLKVAKGEKVYIGGTVVDENCNPVAGALVDLWQACHSGKYLHDDDPNPAELDPNFQYWAKLKTDNAGLWRVKTIIPGAYPASATWTRPPHIHFKISKKGFHILTTQMYFDDPRFADLNAKDPLLQNVSLEEQKRVLVKFENGVGRFNIGIQSVQTGS